MSQACEWEQSMPYGIFYRSSPTAATEKFLDFIRKTYSTGNPQGVVPVLHEYL